MRKKVAKEAHRFKHKIVVSQYLAADLDGSSDADILAVDLKHELSGAELYAEIHSRMISSSDEYSFVLFRIFTNETDDLPAYEQKASTVIDAVQSFFLEYHQTKIERVELASDNDILRALLTSRSTKH